MIVRADCTEAMQEEQAVAPMLSPPHSTFACYGISDKSAVVLILDILSVIDYTYRVVLFKQGVLF